MIPRLVYDDVSNAVQSALQFGVSAEDFLKIVRQEWGDELRLKRSRDDDVLRASQPDTKR